MQKNKYSLSVIVPVYNAADKLSGCIGSILGQTYNDFELILVDDGSTDRSGMLCDEYALKDDRIRIIHIKNSGPFQARKAGVQKAHGEILAFSDADDWFELNAFETAMEIFEKNNPDIFLYTYICENNYIEKNLYNEGLYRKMEIQEKIIPGMMYDPAIGKRRLNPSLCCKFIRKDLYENVSESVKDKITFGEDALITYPAVCMAESIYVCNKALYHYTSNDLSCIHTYPLERIIEIKSFQNNMMCFFDEMGILNDMRYQIENYVRLFLTIMVRSWYRIELSPIPFCFPYNLIQKGSKIFIYGAGIVGESYINELKLSNYADVVGWADQNYATLKMYNNTNIISPELIKEKNFDKLLIAILDEEIAFEIKDDLIKMGIPEKKIIWEKPIRIV